MECVCVCARIAALDQQLEKKIPSLDFCQFSVCLNRFFLAPFQVDDTGWWRSLTVSFLSSFSHNFILAHGHNDPSDGKHLFRHLMKFISI